MGNTSDKYAGKAKQTAGKMTNNKKMQAKGKLQETKADFKDTINL